MFGLIAIHGERLIMSGKYTISTQIGFSASHMLKDYEGNCSNIHGHNWFLRVYYEFEELDKRGLTIDYLELRSRLEEVILPRFDHVNLNDVAPFNMVNPTSENLAKEIFRIIRERVDVGNGILKMVEIWETPVDMVRYSEE